MPARMRASQAGKAEFVAGRAQRCRCFRGRDHAAGAPTAARAVPGSRSKASIPWTATARRWRALSRSPIGMTAFLVIDEAHATGVFGPGGRGLAAASRGPRQYRRAPHLRQGARRLRRAGHRPRTLCDYLVNRCRPFIYSTAPSPLMAVAAREALRMLSDEPERRAGCRSA